MTGFERFRCIVALGRVPNCIHSVPYRGLQ